MAIRRIGGVAGAHALDGPGWFNGARVVVGNLTGPVGISAQVPGAAAALVSSGFASGAVVNSVVGGGVQIPSGAQLLVRMANAVDLVDVDYSNAFG